MIAIVDVQYADPRARAACVFASQWGDEKGTRERAREIAEVAPYQPGALYLRELPPLLAVLEILEELEAILVDAYVWLGEGKPGLGARLHDALDGKIPIVGVAKTPFHGASSVDIVRGQSAKPLHVTAVGMDVRDAAERVRTMHGPHRVPTLLKRADAIARGALPSPD